MQGPEIDRLRRKVWVIQKDSAIEMSIICLTNTATRQINQAYIFLGGRRSSTHAQKLRRKTAEVVKRFSPREKYEVAIGLKLSSSTEETLKTTLIFNLSLGLSVSVSLFHTRTYIHTHAPHVVWLAVCYFTGLVLIMVFTNSRPEL